MAAAPTCENRISEESDISISSLAAQRNENDAVIMIFYQRNNACSLIRRLRGARTRAESVRHCLAHLNASRSRIA